MFVVECVTLALLVYESYRECMILIWHIETAASSVRVWMYGIEHVFLGMVITEGLHYVERCKKARKRRREIH